MNKLKIVILLQQIKLNLDSIEYDKIESTDDLELLMNIYDYVTKSIDKTAMINSNI